MLCAQFSLKNFSERMGALVCATVSKFLYVYGTDFQFTPTLPSLIFDWHCSAPFSSSPKNWIVNCLKTQYLILKSPPPQTCSQFLQCSGKRATLGNTTASPIFYEPPLHCKVRISQHKKCQQPLWEGIHQTWFQRTNWTLTRQGALDLQSPSNHFFSNKNHHFHPSLSSLQISEFASTGIKSAEARQINMIVISKSDI